LQAFIEQKVLGSGCCAASFKYSAQLDRFMTPGLLPWLLLETTTLPVIYQSVKMIILHLFLVQFQRKDFKGEEINALNRYCTNLK
jgi:hypothetical protein